MTRLSVGQQNGIRKLLHILAPDEDSQPYDDPLQSFAPEAWFQLKGVCYFKQTPEQKAFATRPSIA